MPTQNQSDPNSVPPVSVQQTDLPPLPPDFQNVPEEKPVVQQSTDVNNGSAAPADLPPMITTPKKKFGTGKIIATILGIFLLVGGVGAGIVLTQQPQLLQQKAATFDCGSDNSSHFCTANCAPGHNQPGNCNSGVCCNQEVTISPSTTTTTTTTTGADCSGLQCTLNSMKCQQDKNGKNTGYDCKCIDTSKNNNVCTHDWQCNDRDLSACPTESGEMDPSAGTYSGCKSPDGTIVGDIEGRCIVARSGQSLPQMTKYTCPNSSSINSAGCQKNEQIVPAGASSVCFESNFCGVQQIDAVGSYANCFMEVLDTASCSTTPPTSQPSIPTPTEIPAAPYCAAVEAFR
jgi:hypothetical protein